MKDSKEDLKIKKSSMAEMVCDKIKESIQKNVWKTGERLPSESDLAETFGVNRLTVRLAIQKLNALGLVETRTGSGTYVVEFNFDSFIDEISEFYMSPDLLDDVSEFRMLLEVKCAELAIERGTPEELEKLRELSELYNYNQRLCYTTNAFDDYKKLAKDDLNIHQQICNMSHNSLFIYSFSVAKESIYQYLMIINKQRLDHWKQENVDVDNILNSHIDLYEAIRDKDVELVRKIYTDMINRHVIL
jgi:GntR family transcriptional repressor for pyruvate dehydrogenase complex